MLILPGYLLSPTRCCFDCKANNAGVVTLGESFRLVAAGGLIESKNIYEFTFDAMVPQEFGVAYYAEHQHTKVLPSFVLRYRVTLPNMD